LEGGSDFGAELDQLLQRLYYREAVDLYLSRWIERARVAGWTVGRGGTLRWAVNQSRGPGQERQRGSKKRSARTNGQTASAAE